MRCVELYEAQPPKTLRGQVYYHGTQSTQAAESILRDGLLPDMKTTYKGDLRPAKGRVYLATDLNLTLVHALGPRWKTKMPSDFNTDRQFGYVFVIKGKDLADIDPDEDSIGEFLWMHTSGHPDNSNNLPKFDARHDTEPEVRHEIWDFIMQHGKPGDTRESLIVSHKRPHAWASLGKTLHPIMPDWMKLKLIQWGAAIAHIGMVRPSQCWRIARSDVHKLEGVSNFFQIAERIR